MCARPRRLDPDAIVQAAAELLREHGWKEVTARSIAAHLGTSTTPIYSVYASLETIEDDLRMRLTTEFLERLLTPRSDNPVLDLAFGYVLFARDEPRLFEFLFGTYHRKLTSAGAKELERLGFVKRVRELLGDGAPNPIDIYFGDATPDMSDDVIFKGWVFAHGLARLIGDAELQGFDDEAVRQLLAEAAAAFNLYRS